MVPLETARKVLRFVGVLSSGEYELSKIPTIRAEIRTVPDPLWSLLIGMGSNKTVIVTGTSRGIGAAVVQAFLDRGYKVVARARSVSKAGFAPSPKLSLVDGDIGHAATTEKVSQTAISEFGSIDHLVNNAGIFPSREPHRGAFRRGFR